MKKTGSPNLTALLLVGLIFGGLIPFVWASYYVIDADPIEYFATAYALVHGQGFVNPIKTIYWEGLPVPFPAGAFRPAFFPLLIAFFMKIFSTITPIKFALTFWASLTAGAAYLVARRIMSEAMAILAVLYFFTTPAWYFVVIIPLTEPTACLFFLITILLFPWGFESKWGALCLGVCLWIAWTIKPQLVLMGPLLALVQCYQKGFKAALKSPGIWIAGGLSLGLIESTRFFYHQATGFWPNEVYGAWFRVASNLHILDYPMDFKAPLLTVFKNLGPQILSQIKSNVILFFRVFVGGFFGYITWLTLPVIISFFSRAWNKNAHHLILALTVAIFTAFPFLAWSMTDERRYYHVPMLAFTLLCFAYLDQHVWKWFNTPSKRKVFYLICTIWIFAGIGLQWQHHRNIVIVVEAKILRGVMNSALKPFCPADKTSVIASDRPWDMHVICGNPIIVFPNTMTDEAAFEAFVQKEKPVSIFLISRPQAFFIKQSPLVLNFQFAQIFEREVGVAQIENTVESMEAVPSPLEDLFEDK